MEKSTERQRLEREMAAAMDEPLTPAMRLLVQLTVLLEGPNRMTEENGLAQLPLDADEAADLEHILQAYDSLVSALTDLMAAPTAQDTVDRLVISTTPMVRSRAQAALRLALEHR